MIAIIEQDVQNWERDQRLCDIADEILQILVTQRVNIGDSLQVLAKATKTIEASTRSANWGEPLVCGAPQNEAHTWKDYQTVAEEVNRRKAQSNVQNH